MIDTGASDVVINLAQAKKIGINIKKLKFNKLYQTANGISKGATTKIAKLEFASINFKNIPISINSGNQSSALLGMSFLRKFKKYEFYSDKLILTTY